MRIIQMCVLAFILALLPACNEENESLADVPANNALLSISTEITTGKLRTATTGTISSFPENSELGLYIARHKDIDIIYDMFGTGSNIRSKLTGGNWSQYPVVMLGSEPATVFAYYPYKESNNNPRKVPVEHISQTDYMYGSHSMEEPEVNSLYPHVNLTMKHALALVQFNIYKEDYPRVCLLNKIEVSDGNGVHPVLFSEGTMDISTGEITCISGKNDPVTWTPDIPIEIGKIPSTKEQDYARLLVMPVQQMTGSGFVQVRFHIGNEIIDWQVPYGTQWKSGTKNTYTLHYTGKELHLIIVYVEPWRPGIEAVYPLE